MYKLNTAAIFLPGHPYIESTAVLSDTVLLMLNWFVDQEVSERATRGGDLIVEDEVECGPENIPRKCLDDNVCIGQIRKYFSFDAWNLLEATMDNHAYSR